MKWSDGLPGSHFKSPALRAAASGFSLLYVACYWAYAGFYIWQHWAELGFWHYGLLAYHAFIRAIIWPLWVMIWVLT